jgi:hypothetical protein
MWGTGPDTAAKPGTSAPTPSHANGKRYRCKLSSIADVNREMQRIYRECRSNLVEVGDGSKLVHMLSLIARVHETSDLEARLAALETGR